MKTMQRQFDKHVHQVHVAEEPVDVLQGAQNKDTAD